MKHPPVTLYVKANIGSVTEHNRPHPDVKKNTDTRLDATKSTFRDQCMRVR